MSDRVDQYYRALTEDPIGHLTQALIGSILLGKTPQHATDAFCALTLSVDEVIDPRGAVVWQAMANVIAAGNDLDITSIDIEMVRMGKSDAVGGAPYLANCVMTVNIWQLYDETRDTIEGYAAQLRDASVGRRLIAKLSELHNRALRNMLSGSATLTESIAELESLASATKDETALDAIPIGRVVIDAYRELQDLAARREAGDAHASLSVPTGIESLTQALGGGWPLGVISLIGARPGTGKSSLALTAADFASLAGYPVHAFSLEDQARTFAIRYLAQRSQVPGTAIKELRMDMQQLQNVDAQAEFARIREGWLCSFRRGMTAREMCRSMKRERKANGTKLGVIDFMKLVNHENPRLDVRQRISENLKIFADFFGTEDMAGLVLTQLNRESNRRGDDRRPRQEDFADSGDQEQFAKVVIGIYRGSYGGYDPVEGVDYGDGTPYAARPDDAAFSRMAQMIIQKNANATDGIVHVGWDGPTYRFLDLNSPELIALGAGGASW